jgi:hypothetical protein
MKSSVYITDALWRRAQAVLGEEIPLSQLCQQALEAEIRRAGQRRQVEADLDAKLDVAALRAQFGQERAKLYRLGYELGVTSAEDFTYAHLRYFESIDWDPDRITGQWMPDHVLDELIGLDGHSEAEGATLAQRTGEVIEVKQGLMDALHRVWDLVNGEADAAIEEVPSRRRGRK